MKNPSFVRQNDQRKAKSFREPCVRQLLHSVEGKTPAVYNLFLMDKPLRETPFGK